FVASSAIYVGLAIAAVVLGSAAKKVVRQAAVEVKFVVVPAAVIAVLVLAGVAHAKKFSACPAGTSVKQSILNLPQGAFSAPNDLDYALREAIASSPALTPGRLFTIHPGLPGG